MNARAMTKPAFAFFLPVVLALAACDFPAPTQPAELAGTALDGAPIGGSFTLTDKDGKRVSWDQFKGKYRIVYFGFAFCPDACPLDVGTMMQGFNRFAKDHPAKAAEVQPIFITIDPARDTPAKVGEFTAAFSPKLLGLTGTQAEIDGVVKAFKVYAARGKDTPGGYLMDHSRQAYLMDREGKPLVALAIDKGPEAVAADLALLVK
jgi:protein SCO1/2